MGNTGKKERGERKEYEMKGKRRMEEEREGRG